MKTSQFLALSWFGLKTIILKRQKPILGTIILTDRCNLNCRHCAVNNISGQIYSYWDIRQEMEELYQAGIRILFFCGGETLLWEDQGRNVRDLIREARQIGFYLVNIVTNGTIDLWIPEADVIFLSLDGLKETHDLIRGCTYDKIMDNLSQSGAANVCLYMAINRLNQHELEEVGRLVQNHPNLMAISFNFHTPYPGTAHLSLSSAEKAAAVGTIKQMIRRKLPVFNLASSLNAFLDNSWVRPCPQCLVSENGRRFVCGRCGEITGLCEECGYLFAVEFSLLFKGEPTVIWEALRTYLKYV